jgi:hypothetical protein
VENFCYRLDWKLDFPPPVNGSAYLTTLNFPYLVPRQKQQSEAAVAVKSPAIKLLLFFVVVAIR